MNMREIRVLHIERDDSFAERLQELLRLRQKSIHFTAVRARDLAAALERLRAESFDAVLSDEHSCVGAPSAQALVAALQEAAPYIPVILVAEFPAKDDAVSYIRLGVQDCLFKRHLTDDDLKRTLLFSIERALAAGRLARQVKFSEKLFDAIPTPLFFKDLNGTYLGCNTAWERFAGCTRDRIIGRKVEEVFPKEIADLFRTMDTRVFHRPHLQTYETVIPVPELGPRSVIFNKAPYYSSDGMPEGLIGIVTDITERKVAEEKCRTLVEGAEATITCIDRDGKILFVNNNGARFFDCGPEDLVGKNMADIFPREVAEERLKDIRAVIDGGSGRIVEGDVAIKGGRFHYRSSIQPMRDPSGRVAAVLIISDDMTRLRQAEQALQMSEEKYRQVVEGAGSAIIVYDRDGTVLYMNMHAARKIGRQRDWCIGRKVAEIVPLDVAGRWLGYIREVIDTGKRKMVEDMVMLERGPFYYRASLYPNNEEWFGVPSVLTIGDDLTDLRRAEKALRETESKYRLIVEGARFAIVNFGYDGTILFINARAASVLGASPEALVGKKVHEVVPAAVADNWLSITQEVIDSDRSTIIEGNVELNKGPFSYRASVHPNAGGSDGRPSVLVFADDVTELHSAKLALQRAEEQYRVIVDSTQSWITIGDENGKLLFMNAAAARNMGGRPEDFLGKNARDFFPPEVFAVMLSRVREVLDRGKLRIFDDIVPMNGELRHFRNHLQPITLPGASPRAVLTILDDITDLKRTQEELQKEKERYRLLFNSSNDAILVHYIDENGTLEQYIEANDAACRMLGYSREELLRLAPMDLHFRLECHMPREQVSRELIERKNVIFERLLRTKDGRMIPCEVSSCMFDWNDRHLVISIERDITERKRAEQENELLQRQLMQSAKLAAIGQLASGVAHELSNPLTIILAVAQRLQQDRAGGDELQPKMESIERAASRCRSIINSLLSFSREEDIDAQGTQCMEINEVLERSIFFAAHQTEMRRVEIVKDFASNLPLVKGYAQRLEQVFINLMINAGYAMPDGGRLTITTRLNGDRIEIAVADTGTGIPEEHLDRIFDPFFTTKPEGRGTGLGLSICADIVEKHRGNISVRSAPGKGTVFTVDLPTIISRASRPKKEQRGSLRPNA